MGLRHFAPAGLNHFVQWQSRFRAVGFDRRKALRATLSRPMRRILVESRIEHLPTALRGDLEFVVDVGANAGQWLSAFMVFANVRRLEAFEPNPEAFLELKRLLDNRPGARLHNFALGDEHTTLNLNVMQNSFLSSALPATEVIRREYPTGARVIKQVPVKVFPLDQVLSEEIPIDLIKIDVQGFEHPVLRGARKALQRTRAVLIETNFVSHYEGDGSFGTLFSHLDELGFDFWDVSSPYRGSARQALWADAVFLNRSLRQSA